MKKAAGAMLLALLPAVTLAAEGPADDWRGLYVGAQLGAGRADAHWTSNATIATGDTVEHDVSAVASGLQLGYRFRVAPSWVVGVEGSYTWARFRTFALSDELTSQGAFGRFRETDFRNLYAVTAQVGYADEGWLLYGKAGAAGSYVYLSTLNGNNGVSSSLTDRPRGWTVGTGVDYLLKDRWSFGVEYDHYELSLGDRTVAGSNGGLVTYSGFTGKINIFLARLNRTFF
jgi:outer membrane autotransporter protein